MKEVVLINMYTEDDNVYLQTIGKKMFDSLENSTHRIIICDSESPVIKISKINIAKTIHEQMYYEWKDGKYAKVESDEDMDNNNQKAFHKLEKQFVDIHYKIVESQSMVIDLQKKGLLSAETVKEFRDQLNEATLAIGKVHGYTSSLLCGEIETKDQASFLKLQN